MNDFPILNNQFSCSEWSRLCTRTPPSIPEEELINQKRNHCNKMSFLKVNSEKTKKFKSNKSKKNNKKTKENKPQISKSKSTHQKNEAIKHVSQLPSIHMSQIEFSNTIRLDSESITQQQNTSWIFSTYGC